MRWVSSILLLLVGFLAISSLCDRESPKSSVAANPISILGVAISASSLLFNVLKREANPEGRFIFAKSNDGCLDGGKRVAEHEALVFPYHMCKPEPWLKWRFDGRLLILSHTANFMTGGPVCMDCWREGPDCDIYVLQCHGGTNQQWTIKVFPHQINQQQRRVYFSIMSFKHPDRCLTLNRQNSVLDYERGIYKCRDANWSLRGYCLSDMYWDYPTIKWDMYRLAPCTGSDDQSFYLEHQWFGEIDQMIQDVNKG